MSERSERRPLRVAMIGQRGVPAAFGGIERHVEEIGARLVDRGHDVTVFCRPNYVEERAATYRGMRLRYLPTLGTKHFDAIVHSLVSTIAAIGDHFDVIHYHALGPGLVAPLPRLVSRARVVITVHGLDDERAKWSGVARRVLRTAQWMSARVPHETIVVSSALAEHYATVHHRRTSWISNGAPATTPRPAVSIRHRFDLEPRSYILFVGRFVPEKAPDLLIRAFRQIPGDLRLVLAGGSSFTDDYESQLRSSADRDPRILFPGYVYGTELDELYSNAAAFVLPSLLEGLPLTLLEAAAHGTPVVASDIPPHLEVLGPTDRPGRRLFAAGDESALAAALSRVLADGVDDRAGAELLRREVLDRYDWDRAAEETERVYLATGRREASSEVGTGSARPLGASVDLARRAG